jgi:tRNA G18 (ribose-2'-O)-methylase SpoU
MAATYYEIRLCRNCGLRYPLTEGHPFGIRCPACLGETLVVLKRTISLFPLRGEEAEMRGEIRFSALLDNIRSAWNVGSIFRTADGLGVEKLYLCGITPTPENESVTKTSLGAEDSVEWEYSRNALDVSNLLKTDGYRLIALEQDERAFPVGAEGAKGFSPLYKTVLILGNEVTGVDPELLDLCDTIIHIPMKGKKRSLNVEVAFGIAAHFLLTTQTLD